MPSLERGRPNPQSRAGQAEQLDNERTAEQRTSSLTADSDNDALTELSELTEDQGDPAGDQFTNPVDSDTDNDLLADADPADPDPTVGDTDYGGIMDGIDASPSHGGSVVWFTAD